MCRRFEIKFEKEFIKFPERVVKLIFANRKQLTKLIGVSDFIAEIRRAPVKTSFFTELEGQEQQEWVHDLLERTTFDIGNVTICVLDTGINYAHPLLSQAIEKNGVQALKPTWDISDENGHGTSVAGIALYDDLRKSIASSDPIVIHHGVESVKILNEKEPNAPKLYGDVTADAINLAEIENPQKHRIICMAVSCQDFNTDDGSPTSWSAELDQIISGARDNDIHRLFLVSAGNVEPEEQNELGYPTANVMHQVENPGQSWNAVTVGAYSKDVNIDSEDFNEFFPVADVDELSPYSSTSRLWDAKWPIKPDVLFDGGNMAQNGIDYTDAEELSLLTTNNDFNKRPLTSINATSSATAQASWMAAKLYQSYPEIWPETVRALIIHSASWTEKMKKQFCIEDTKAKGRRNLLRTCGYGIPNLEKAIESKENSVNLVIEDTIQPYIVAGKGVKLNEMKFYLLQKELFLLSQI